MLSHPFSRRACALALTAVIFFSGSLANARDKPNIIYILADDLGYGDLGSYGQKLLRTPNLDAMAAEGIRFTQHYAGSTVCAPSRCVLLTGLHTGHCRIRSNSPALLRDEDITVAEVLKKAGYRTGCVGKWGVGHPPPFGDPKRNGFDYFCGYTTMWHAHNFYPEFVVRNGERVPLRNKLNAKWKKKTEDGRGVAQTRVDYVPDLVTEEALSFIERNQKRPFFLFYSLNVPHANNEAGDAGMEVPSTGVYAVSDWPEPEKGFAKMIQNIDRDVGKVLNKLKELGLDENTLVLFTSDNGPHQEGGHKHDFFDSNGPLRGFKRDLYEGGIRVPMIARWPGKIPAGKTSDHISSFQDMLATFAALVGTPAPKTDGISFAPTLLGAPEKQTKHASLYWEFRRAHHRAVRKGKWKALRLTDRRTKETRIELYDLSQDIGESNNVADRHPKILAEMLAIMESAHVELEENAEHR